MFLLLDQSVFEIELLRVLSGLVLDKKVWNWCKYNIDVSFASSMVWYQVLCWIILVAEEEVPGNLQLQWQGQLDEGHVSDFSFLLHMYHGNIYITFGPCYQHFATNNVKVIREQAMWWRGITGVLITFLIRQTVVCFCHIRR